MRHPLSGTQNNKNKYYSRQARAKKTQIELGFSFSLARLIAGHKSGGQDGLTGFWPKCKTVFIIFVLDNVLKISQQV